MAGLVAYASSDEDEDVEGQENLKVNHYQYEVVNEHVADPFVPGTADSYWW